MTDGEYGTVSVRLVELANKTIELLYVMLQTTKS